jgi:hypothetical protein
MTRLQSYRVVKTGLAKKTESLPSTILGYTLHNNIGLNPQEAKIIWV